MSHLLNHSEVDALFEAVDTARVDAAPSCIFSFHGAARADVQFCDFKRPERVSAEQLGDLEALHQGFARKLEIWLTGYLRTVVEVSAADVEQRTYSEFIHALPNPTCLNLLQAEQLDGPLCLELSPLIIYPMIDRLLGGSNADLFIPHRPLTQIEQRLAQRIIDRAMQYLSEAWSTLTPVTFTVNKFESNPELMSIARPNETVVVIGFDLKMGSQAGTMGLCIPYKVIEPAMDMLAAQKGSSDPRSGAPGNQAPKRAKKAPRAAVEARAFLAETTIRLSDLLALEVGDVITTDQPITRDVFVQVEETDKFHGQVGQFHGNRAIRITRACRVPGEEPECLGEESEAPGEEPLALVEERDGPGEGFKAGAVQNAEATR